MSKSIVVFNGDNYSSPEAAIADHADYTCEVADNVPNDAILAIAQTISVMVWNDPKQVQVYADGVQLNKY